MSHAKLVIFRHGQTEYNRQHLVTGHRDVPLNATGEAQAREIGGILKDEYFHAVYSSTLGRAFNTAALALDQTAVNHHLKGDGGAWQIIADKSIIEKDAGEFAGRCHRTDPEIQAFDRAYDKKTPGGESPCDVVERVQRFYRDEILPRLERGENVLVVCHAGIVRAFRAFLDTELPEHGNDPDHFKKRVPNATPTVYEYKNGSLMRMYQIENPKEVAANENKQPAAPKPPKSGNAA